MYYSEKLANRYDEVMRCYRSVLLVYEVDGILIEANIKMHKEDISEVQSYLPDMKLVFTMNESGNQKYIGTRCIGQRDGKRCHEVLVSKPGQQNSCAHCWNAMRNFMGF